MAINGYGLTLVGAAVSGSTPLGAITGIEGIQIGGLEVDFDEIATVADLNHVVENLPGKVREGPMTITLAYSKTIYAAFRTAATTHTLNAWTLTDIGGSTHVGDGYVKSVGGKNLDTNGHASFNVALQPKTQWAFTAN